MSQHHVLRASPETCHWGFFDAGLKPVLRVVSGDTMFIDACGRVDFPGGNAEQMYYSLTQKLMALPDDTFLFPGHNYARLPHATIGEQKKLIPTSNLLP